MTIRRVTPGQAAMPSPGLFTAKHLPRRLGWAVRFEAHDAGMAVLPRARLNDGSHYDGGEPNGAARLPRRPCRTVGPGTPGDRRPR